MIVKNEGNTIERVLDCVSAFADEIVVVDTGSTDDTVSKAEKLNAVVHRFDWIDDFSAARNFSFSQCTKDWILWLDGDDFISPESQDLICKVKRDVLNNKLDAIYFRYNYPPFRQWRERMIRRALFDQKKLKWVGAVHECISGINNENVRYFDDVTIEHDPPPDRHLIKKDRNIAIIRKHYNPDSVDERELYLYAVECLHSLYRAEGERVIKRFFSAVTIPEYRYEIYSKMYNFYIHFNEPELALEALSKAIVEDPSRAEAYYKLGRHVCDKQDRPASSIPLLVAASVIPTPNYGAPEMEAYTYGPWEWLCRANFRLGQLDLAKQMADKAIETNSRNQNG